jgi:Cof subfamily protein (haloacid dehalogenase superfamily)
VTVKESNAIKLVAIDVDYTLIGGDLKISVETKQAIHNAIDAGCQVTLATGRMYRATVPFAEELGLNSPLITYDGAFVKNAKTRELYWHRPIPLEYAHQILEHLRSLGCHINAYINDEIYVECMNDKIRRYMAHVNVGANVVGNLSDFLEEPPTKLLVISTPEIVNEILPVLKQKFGDKSHIVRSMPTFIEFTGKGVTKGAALATLAEDMGLLKDQVMAIGDSENDITMLSYAGIGVAVGNADDKVKEAADYITKGINGDGVQEAISRFVLGV